MSHLTDPLTFHAAVYKMERLKTEFNALNKEIGQLRKVCSTAGLSTRMLRMLRRRVCEDICMQANTADRRPVLAPA